MKFNKLMAVAKFKIVKYSPEILLVGGLASIGAGVVLACSATTKLEGVLDKYQDVVGKINQTKELWEKGDIANDLYSEKEYNKDIAITRFAEAGELIKLYAPAAIALVGGTVSILAAHKILHKRHVAAVAAFKAVDEAFRKYRGRVIEDLGSDKDFEYRTGIKATKVGHNEDGSTIIVETDGPIPPGKDLSFYDRWFDEGSRKWEKTAERNLFTLKLIEQEANRILERSGHIFLNEVYDLLDIPRSQAGQVVGWVKDGDGDGYVDFGIYEVLSDYAKSRQEFVNGLERNILLSFNVDGVIVDKI